MTFGRRLSNLRLGNLNRTHGMSKLPEFRVWVAMRARCENEHESRYEDYGGRGIKVCPRWSRSFAAFMKDMGRRPSPEYSIERIANQGNYEPGNCRWATRREQQNNTRRNRRVMFMGLEMTLAEWSRQLGLGRNVLSKRLRLGWSVEEALFTDPLKP